MIRYFASHPTAANLLMFGLVVIGLMSLPTLKRETFPDFTPQDVQVTVPYPGAGAADVEEAVCQRLEDAVDGLNDVDEVRCGSCFFCLHRPGIYYRGICSGHIDLHKSA